MDGILSLTLGFVLEYDFQEFGDRCTTAAEEKPKNCYFGFNEERETFDDSYVAQIDCLSEEAQNVYFDEYGSDHILEQPVKGEEVPVEKSSDIELQSLQPRRYSSRILFNTYDFSGNEPVIRKQPPRVRFDRSEEEVPSVRTQKRRSARVKALQTRRERQVIVQAAKSLQAFSHVASSKSITGKRNIGAWKDVHRTTHEWLLNIRNGRLTRKTEFYAYFINCTTVLETTMNAARPRPEETHKLMLRFVIDYVKVYELSQSCGVKEVIGEINKLFERVIGKYLSRDTLMNPTHLPWVQTREVFELMLSIISREATILGVLQTINKMEQYFVRKCDPVRFGLQFDSYALSQLHLFRGVLIKRLCYLCNKSKFHF